MTTAKDLLSLPSLSHMKLIGGAAGLSRTVTWPYVILCPPIGEWVSGGEFLIYYGANAVVEKVELAQLHKTMPLAFYFLSATITFLKKILMMSLDSLLMSLSFQSSLIQVLPM